MMENLIKRLEDTKLRVFYCPTDRENIEEAIKCLKHYFKICELVNRDKHRPQVLLIELLDTFKE